MCFFIIFFLLFYEIRKNNPMLIIILCWIAELHKVHMYLEYHSVCPLVRIGTPLTPLPQASLSPPPPAHLPLGVGVGVPIRDDWRKSLSTLCWIGSILLHCQLAYRQVTSKLYLLHREKKDNERRGMGFDSLWEMEINKITTKNAWASSKINMRPHKDCFNFISC